MKTNILKIAILTFALLVSNNVAFASQVHGEFSTGISGTVGHSLEGVVIAPPAASIPPSTGGGGGGSSSSGGGGGGSAPANVIPVGKSDVNKDGRVDVLDFVNLMAHWGAIGSNNDSDFNNDGRVDILDFVILMANWTR